RDLELEEVACRGKEDRRDIQPEQGEAHGPDGGAAPQAAALDLVDEVEARDHQHRGRDHARLRDAVVEVVKRGQVARYDADADHRYVPPGVAQRLDHGALALRGNAADDRRLERQLAQGAGIVREPATVGRGAYVDPDVVRDRRDRLRVITGEHLELDPLGA